MKFLMIIATLTLILPFAAASGYGTSSINLQQSSVSLLRGGSSAINYTVSLASGNTWGTELIVLNKNELASNGIYITVSPAMGDPPFSGRLTLSVSQNATIGASSVLLAATGDDPSATNATLTVLVEASGNSSAGTTTAIMAHNFTSNSTIGHNGTTQQITEPRPAVGNAFGIAPLAAAIAVVVIIAGSLGIMIKTASGRLILAGVALILVGTEIWIYGDYNGGLMQYIWTGVGMILIGTVIWLVGDYKGGQFYSLRK